MSNTAQSSSRPPLNVMSVDVEDYHDQLALDFQERIVPPNEEARRCTDLLLDLFAEYDVKGTLFVLGEIAEHFPQLVRRIADEGHHLGVHGYYHYQVFRQSRDQFRESVGRAKKLIEDVSGASVDAHRAVAFSVGANDQWVFDALVDLGFAYDSSIFPFKGRRYGIADAPRHPYQIRCADGRTMWEVPLSVVERWGRRWPACGGGYLRMFPMAYNEWAIRKLNGEGIGAVVYLHPYEVEPNPAIEMLDGLTFKQRCQFRFFNFHQKRRRRATVAKLRYLMSRYRFGTIRQLIDEWTPSSSSTVTLESA